MCIAAHFSRGTWRVPIVFFHSIRRGVLQVVLLPGGRVGGRTDGRTDGWLSVIRAFNQVGPVGTGPVNRVPWKS
ncbi:MAG: hypothetical protein ACTSUE_02100 [Promethearchaeota archaeon]